MRSSISMRLSPGLAAFALVALSCAHAAPAQKVEIVYEVSRNGTAIAETVENLEHDGKSYRIAARMKGKGLFALRGDAARTSRGGITAEGLRPAEFEDQRSGREPLRARFDWQANTLFLQAGDGASESKPMPPNAHDRLSYLYSFAFKAPGAKPVAISITDGKGVSSVVYEAQGKETLKTPAGEFETLRLVRRKNAADDRSTEIWLASGHGHLPVRILAVEKDGTRIDQVATRLSAPQADRRAARSTP